MIIYTYDTGHYLTLAESLKRQPQGLRSVYLNLTNRCTCSCTFCLRNLKKMDEQATLWLKQEPSREEVRQLLQRAPWSVIGEIVFCGFGEPTMRLDDVVELLRYIKSTQPQVKTRINTNGLADLEYGRDTSAVFANHILDTISISLNASNADRYLALTRSKFGRPSFEAMLRYAVHCQQYVPNVVMTVVDQVEDPAEIEACRALCQKWGLTLRVRAYEAN
jgi:TatD family-associated radical SAM protein